MSQNYSIEQIVTPKGLEGILLHCCDSNPRASDGPIYAQFSNGKVSKVINRGVAVSRWATAAFYMK